MRDEFKVHLLNDDGIAAATEVAEVFSEALDKLSRVPTGRARSLMITKLQEASYWAKRGIAEDPKLQKTP